ncbi:plasmid partitioning protein RepB [Ensifer sp. HO-A22]|uniref:Plasmid partitioning protein RepB n=1 Tax=Ensifer oleiphilus TaxID=2742698 RepID=A0A7Y6URB3_9HYPH|nr:plasmid partitioning protein RepB [Ensifer oleiphilus]NVD42869.1 plasmid partitioning protein RepB [Ensifer oleiphilus]
MSRKDSKGLFANVLGQLDGAVDRGGVQRSTSPHLMKVAAGVRQIQERSELADRLLRDGGQVIEIEPADILDSAIPDRFGSAYEAGNLAELMQSMREHGQSTPGLVRSVDGNVKSFQIVFGRRRLAAAKLLGIKFKAIARDLSDEEAIVLQGEENSNRNDLSFIERCLFAQSQEAAGYGRDIICKSLSTSKSHVSEMIRLATALPREVVQEIGPAPEVGRRRWVDFEAKWSAHAAPFEAAKKVLGKDETRRGDSNARFARVLEALSGERDPALLSVEAVQLVAHGLVLGQVSHGKSGSKLAFNKAVPNGFVEYVATQIETLHDQFMQKNPR